MILEVLKNKNQVLSCDYMFNEVGFKWGDQNRGKMVKIKVNVTSFW